SKKREGWPIGYPSFFVIFSSIRTTYDHAARMVAGLPFHGKRGVTLTSTHDGRIGDHKESGKWQGSIVARCSREPPARPHSVPPAQRSVLRRLSPPRARISSSSSGRISAPASMARRRRS